jgi:hypothetical protein
MKPRMDDVQQPGIDYSLLIGPYVDVREHATIIDPNLRRHVARGRNRADWIEASKSVTTVKPPRRKSGCGLDSGDGELTANLLHRDEHLVAGFYPVQEFGIADPKHHRHLRHVEGWNGLVP